MHFEDFAFIITLGKKAQVYYRSKFISIKCYPQAEGSMFQNILRSYILHIFPGQQLAEVACSDDTRPAYISHQNTTLIETIDYPMSHPSGTRCEWIITPDNVPEVDQNVS